MYLTEKNDKNRLLDIIKASSSLPFVSPIVDVDQIPMLDEGISDSIPLGRAMDTGHPFNVVILTHNKSYRNQGKDRKMPHIIYKDYPRLRLLLSKRIDIYNKQLEMIERCEKQGDIICIRPEKQFEVGRMQQDISKLQKLYEHGYELGCDFCKRHTLDR